jgi:hypothetical protein
MEIDPRTIKTWVSFLLFAIMVYIGTGFDYLIHGTLYNYGLNYADDWFIQSQILYFAYYQAIIGILLYLNRSVVFAILTETFSFTGTQDLFYFLIWDGELPAADTQWHWSRLYHFFGSWTTSDQVLLCVVANAVAITLSIVYVVFMWKRKKS